MGFLDEVRVVLRNPPGLDSTLPDGLMARCRSAALTALESWPNPHSIPSAHRLWADPNEFQSRIHAGWRSLSRGLLGVRPQVERIEILEQAVYRHLHRPLGDGEFFGGNMHPVVDLQRLGSALSEAPWRDPVRYLVELGALDDSATRRTSLGETLVRLGVREQVIALLHAEAIQSTGDEDHFRLPRWVFRALSNGDRPDDEPMWQWPPLDRLVALGLLGNEPHDSIIFVVEDGRAAWLQDVANPTSPIGILVRSTLDDSAQVALGVTSEPQSARHVRDLAEFVAHELGNKLSSLTLTVNQLGADMGSEHRHVARLRKITSELQQFAGSIDQILPAGGEPATALELLDVLQDALARTASERNGHVAVHLTASESQFFGKRTRLRLAFENLIRNAAQAAPGADRQVNLWILLSRLEGRIEIVFEDDGPGVPANLAGSLFERGTSGRGSSGLGLALVAEIASEHGGSVRHEARPKGGARFVLTLVEE